MNGKERYLIFGLGMFLGCLILLGSYLGKKHSIKKQYDEDFAKGYYEVADVVAGQDFSGKKPFDTGPALFKKDYTADEKGVFKRILIAKGRSKDEPLWRVEETIWRDRDTGRERLIRRRIMYADRIIVRVGPGNGDGDRLGEVVGPLGMKVIAKGKVDGLYRVLISDGGVEGVPEAIVKLSGSNSLIRGVVPEYILTN